MAEEKNILVTSGNDGSKYASKLATNKTGRTNLIYPRNLHADATQNVFLININAISGSKYQGTQYQAVQNKGATIERSTSNSLSRKFGGNTTRIDTTIALYMPPNIQTSYESNYKAAELGAAGAIIDAFTGIGDLSNFETYRNIWNTGKDVAGQYLGMTAAAIASALTPFNVKDAATAYRQTVLNPYMEVIFEGVQNRTFNFTFKFVPQSPEDQKAISEIVKTLKFHRAPEKKIKGVNSIWAFPSTFDISFLKKDGQINEWLFKISTCALTNMQVSYGDGNYASFSDGSPVSTTISLSFMEMEIHTKETILEGF